MSGEVLLRQLECVAALARERHFARAAKACFVSQPALSAGIRKLEIELDVTIVQRGRRFRGVTPEGQLVVGWAHRILAERDGLRAGEHGSGRHVGRSGAARPQQRAPERLCVRAFRPKGYLDI